ncbi:hypothetical protein KLVA111870_02115 [Klebsiella variicola]|uniref:hypothetical protein n=1 Tax=Klebsiella variicola TaxID=244366 RepID=UPI00109B9E4D|nr:hypothetical protein [Klebsiella variicola]VGP71693.1 hypothetical protein SB5387_01069 [Klebsiella variicola]
MEELKFTPGPWHEHREGFSTVYVEATLRDGVIQEVAACGPTEAGSEQQFANARLITAAPELLESLREVIGSLGVMVKDPENCPEIIKARAAIAKALGK